MNLLTLLIFISLLVIIKSIYNPIPIGAVIISTTNMIIVMQPKEYGGSDVLSTIYTAPSGITIIDTVYDPVARNLYLLFTNASSTTSTSTATSATSTSTATSATNATGTTNATSATNATGTTNATSATNATGTTNSTSTANATIGISTSTVTSSTGTTNTAVYLCQLASLEQLDSTVYQLPITFNTANINNLNSFTADIINSRVFLTDQTGAVTLFSMSGLLKTTLSPPSAITNPLRSVAYSNSLNQLFMVTDRSIYACNNLDMGNLSCCEALIQLSQLRSIAFDQSSGDLSPYVLDAKTGIYQIQLNAAGCPVQLSTLNTLGAYVNLYFVVANRLYFASASSAGGTDNSYLVIANGTNVPRVIAVGQTIIALHLSIPSTQTAASDTAETCFNGITYTDYRVAVILAALFGTIMGVFMCFNALFCIDFFMTKRIIRGLKQQIPHNLLEDRWNRLVEEKYAKLALESQFKLN
jgi:hypothetical protein